MTSGNTLTETLWNVPTTRLPPSPARRRVTSSSAWWSCRNTASAWSSRTWPAGVSSTGRGPPGRSKSRALADSALEAAAICWLMADWVKPRRSAARPKDRSGGHRLQRRGA